MTGADSGDSDYRAVLLLYSQSPALNQLFVTAMGSQISHPIFPEKSIEGWPLGQLGHPVAVRNMLLYF